jgi:hypothetical protein
VSGRRDPAAGLVAGRAFVVPASTGNVGRGEDGNFNNFHANTRVTSTTVLVATSAQDGRPVDPASKRVTAALPNWLRFVMYYAGNNDGPWEKLPARLDVPVWIDARTRQVVSLDVDGAASELAAHREVGRREWLETEAPMSDVRALFALPGATERGVRGVVSGFREILGEIRHLGDSTSPPRTITAEELEARRRTAVMLRYKLERSPKDYARVRKSALQAGPMMAANARGGSISAREFDAWLSDQELSGVVTAEEARQWRSDAAER